MKKTKVLIFALFVALLAFGLIGCALGGGGSGGGSVKKVAFTKSMIVRSPIDESGIFVYSGNPLTYSENDFTFQVNGNYPSPSDFEFIYENNVNAGEKTAKLTIKAKSSNKYCEGSVVLYFTILPGEGRASDKTELTALLNDPNLKDISLETSVTVAENEVLTIPAGAALRIDGNVRLICNGKIVVLGKLTVDGATYYGGAVRKGELINNGTVENNGDFSVTERGELINTGVFRSETSVKNAGRVYTNDTGIPNLTNTGSGEQYIRQRLTEDVVTLYGVEGGVEFSQENGYVRPPVSVEHNASVEVEYQGDDGTGEATVTVTTREKDEYYYGSVTKSYVILPGKATVSDYASLKAAHDTRHYDRFEITGNIAIPSDEEFYVHPDETYNFAGYKLIVNGALTNNGTFVSYRTAYGERNEFTLDITVAEGGSYGGTGKISAEKITVAANGDFALNSPESTTFVSFTQSKGNLNINSPFSVPSLTIAAGANLIVGLDGAVETETLTVSGGFDVKGTLRISGKSYFYGDVRRTNSGWIYLGTETYVSDLNFATSGAVINNGDFICDNVTAYFTNGTGFVNNENGHVWAYENFADFTDNITVKKKLSATVVSLEYTEVDYDGNYKMPSVIFNGPAIDVADYKVKYQPKDQPTSGTSMTTTIPEKAGVYTATITVYNKKCAYGGMYVAEYEIVRSVRVVDDKNKLKNIMTNKNYKTVKLGADISFANAYYTDTVSLYESITLDTNGYTLTFDNTNFSSSGTIYVRAAEGNSVLTFINGSDFTNYGDVINEGIVCLTAIDTQYKYVPKDLSAKSGTFLNNGIIYCGIADVCNIPEKEGSTGTKYERTTIVKADLQLAYDETVYDGAEKLPEVSYVGTDAYVTPAIFATYTASYSNNKRAGTATVTVKPNLLNEKYFDYATLNFTIKKASKIVTTSLTSDDFSDSNNYSEVKLGDDIILSEDVVVPAGMSLNFSTHFLSYTSGRLIVEDGATLKAEANSRSSFLRNVNLVHEILLTGNITDRVTVNFHDIDTTTDKIFQAYYSYDGQLYPQTFKIKALRVDMNGYSMTGGLVVDTNSKTYTNPYFSLTVDNTSAIESVIGDVTKSDEYGFEQKFNSNMGERIVVNFNNITVAGIRIYGHNVGRGIQLNATNCTVQTACAYALYNPDGSYNINADSVFTDCTFSATGSAGKIISVYAGEHHFNNCHLTKNDINYRTGSGSHIPGVFIDDVKQ